MADSRASLPCLDLERGVYRAIVVEPRDSVAEEAADDDLVARLHNDREDVAAIRSGARIEAAVQSAS